MTDRYSDDELLSTRCGVSISMGAAHDPYGTSCDLTVAHDGPHQGPNPFGGDDDIRWTGGGTCAGDRLPYVIV